MAVAVANRQRRVAVATARVAQAARAALASVGRVGGDVEVVVVGDDEIRRLNAAWLGVRRRTDVLAFPLCIPNAPSPLVGQVVISADAARRQARRLRVPLPLELDLLVTHGVLHLVGYDDRNPGEARLMHVRERQILASDRRRLPARLFAGLLE